MDAVSRALLAPFALMVALWAGSAFAGEPREAPRETSGELPAELTSRIAEAEGFFQVQDYEKVVRVLDKLAGHPRLEGQKTHIRVLEMLGASHWFLGAPDSGRLIFGQLLRESPFHRLDGFVYPAELIEFYEGRRRELVTAGIIPASPSEVESFTSRRVLVREIEQNDAPAVVYLMPFGVGQFVNGDSGKGATLAVIQGIGAVTMIATWLGIEGLKVGDTNRISPGDEGQARLLEALWYGGAGVFVAGWGYSIADGFANRDTTPVVRERFELLDPQSRSPQPPTTTGPPAPRGPSVQLAPSFLGGPGASLDIRF